MSLRRIPWVPLLLLYLAAGFLQEKLFLNWDVGHLLHASELMLQGGNYLSAFFTPNPPLILYLYLPPVLIYKATGLSMPLVFLLYIFTLIGMVMVFSYPLLEKVLKQRKLCNIFWVATAGLLLLLPLHDFGQRDQLLMLFTLPYFLVLVGRLQGEHYSKAVLLGGGFLAFLGFGIKPQFLFCWFLFEGYLLCRSRDWRMILRPEAQIFYALGSIYLFSVFFFFPEYIYVITPYMVRNYYHCLVESQRMVLWNKTTLFCLLTLSTSMLSLLFLRKSKDPLLEFKFSLILALGIFLVSYFVQTTNFYYHLIPALIYALLFLILCYSDFLLKPKPSTSEYTALLLLALVMMVFLVVVVNKAWIMMYFAPRFSFCFLALFFVYVYWVSQKQFKLLPLLLALTLALLLGALSLHLSASSQGFMSHLTLVTLLVSTAVFALFVPRQGQGVSSMLCKIWVGLALLTYPFFFAYGSFHRFEEYKEHLLRPLVSYLATQAPHSSIYALSLGTYVSSPAFYYSHSVLAQRFDCLWPLLIRLRLTKSSTEQLPMTATELADENFFINLVTDDLIKQKPDFVFVDDKTRYMGSDEHFDFVGYFSKNPKFRQAWKAYHYEGDLACVRFFRVSIYKRKG